jgi:hypothetical protein
MCGLNRKTAALEITFINQQRLNRNVNNHKKEMGSRGAGKSWLFDRISCATAQLLPAATRTIGHYG